MSFVVTKKEVNLMKIIGSVIKILGVSV